MLYVTFATRRSGKIEILPLSYIDAHPYGDIVNRVIADADQFADGLLMGFTQLFTGIVTILGTLFFLFSISWKIAIVVVIVTPLSLFIARFIAKPNPTACSGFSPRPAVSRLHSSTKTGNRRSFSVLPRGRGAGGIRQDKRPTC